MDNYYLQVVRGDDKPKWPRPEEELEVNSQDLGGGYIQYWAYEKGQGEGKLPPAEILAQEHKADKPAILIDAGENGIDSSKEHYLTLVVVKSGHAWGKTESSLANLEDNLTTLLDFVKEHFNINIEHFMTTGSVPEEVDKKLDEIETQEDQKLEVRSEPPEASLAGGGKLESNPWDEIKKVGGVSIGVGIAKPSGRDKGPAKVWMLLPLVVILVIFGSTIYLKDQALGKVKSLNIFSSPTPTPLPPTPTPSPTPTPEVKREEFKVRVLNGTTKSGAAASLKEQLVNLGWDVIKTGNAKNQKMEQTTVSGKKDLGVAFQVMMEDLKGDFEATAGAELNDKDQADLEVVIGKK